MAYYLVKAKAISEKLDELKARLEAEEILPMRPFGTALDFSLKHARLDADDWVVWEEEDYCRPPLAMERAAVLDHYFTNLTVQKVEEGDGWQQIESLPTLWSESSSK
jgi:hypothetical protein